MTEIDLEKVYNKRSFVIAIIFHMALFAVKGSYFMTEEQLKKEEEKLKQKDMIKISLSSFSMKEVPKTVIGGPAPLPQGPKDVTPVTKNPVDNPKPKAPKPVEKETVLPKKVAEKPVVAPPKPEKKPLPPKKAKETTPKVTEAPKKAPKPPAPKVVEKAPVKPNAGTGAKQSTSPKPVAKRPETYKGFNYDSDVNALFNKAEGAGKVAAKSEVAGNVSDGGGSEGGVVGGTDTGEGVSGDATGTGKVKYAKVGGAVGNLTEGTGKLDGNIGTKGLVEKQGYTTLDVPGQTIIIGSMDPSVIRRILAAHIPEFHRCYQRELDRTNSQIDGVVGLNFVIGSSGSVTDADVSRSNMPDSVKSCVVDVVKSIRFPKPKGGGEVTVRQPFNFRAGAH